MRSIKSILNQYYWCISKHAITSMNVSMAASRKWLIYPVYSHERRCSIKKRTKTEISINGGRDKECEIKSHHRNEKIHQVKLRMNSDWAICSRNLNLRSLTNSSQVGCWSASCRSVTDSHGLWSKRRRKMLMLTTFFLTTIAAITGIKSLNQPD